eukprot:1306741-Rhodomonas_salina.2
MGPASNLKSKMTRSLSGGGGAEGEPLAPVLLHLERRLLRLPTVIIIINIMLMMMIIIIIIR